MAEDSENAKILIDGQMMTLADLAGVSLDDVTEKRAGEALPKGFYVFETEGGENTPHLAVQGKDDKAVGAARFMFKVLEVISVTDAEFTGDKDKLIGKFHFENKRIADADGLGYCKAFIKDIGVDNSGPLKGALARCAGARFEAGIMKKKDPNDTDKVYTNINTLPGKIKPVASATPSNVAQAVG